MKKYFFAALISLILPSMVMADIPYLEKQKLDAFKENVRHAYRLQYHHALPKISSEKLEQVKLLPRTLYYYNRDFGTDLTLENAIGFDHRRQRRHSPPVILKLKLANKQARPRFTFGFNSIIYTYARNLPMVMAHQVYIKHDKALEKVQQHYGVPVGIMLGVLGCETEWGNDTGSFDIINSLSTLAFAGPVWRRPMYLQNLVAFLHILPIIQAFHTKRIYISTFDGGMGIPQFEPDNYLRYSKKYNGDGYANIWVSFPDAAASVAHYLKMHGWTTGMPWAYYVKLPYNEWVIKSLAAKKAYRPLSFWLRHGVKLMLQKDRMLTKKDKQTLVRVFIPNYYGHSDRAFLLTSNYEVLMRWNPSMIEALMIGVISDSMEYQHVDYMTFVQ